MATIIDQICSHLEFLGYEIIKGESGAIGAKHKSHFNLLFREFGFGILFTAFFGINSQGKNNKGNLLERVNAFNRAARVCRCYLDQDKDLTIEAYIPSTYEKAAFGTFIETLNNDFALAGKDDVKLFEYME